MNRIQRWPDEAVEPFASTPQVKQAPFHDASHHPIHCTLFAPHHYEPNYAYPLLVWLHGPGDDERQLFRIMPHISLRNYVAVGPRGCCTPEPGTPGFRWRQRKADIDAAERRVFESIEIACDKYRIAADRIFLGGFQCGGTMALRIGLRCPDRVAGVLSIGGRFPRKLAPLSDLRRIRQLPILIAQGRDSLQYPLDVSCGELGLFHAASLHVTLRQYPCGDDLTTQMLHDMDAWMMERINGVASQNANCHAAVLPGESN
jgi:phospholipase/carboxylesterase